ncbi:transglycosylase SLT domain-containing protein [Streptomyces sp. NPDC088360]|uniref:aggregation-promoting factor C-terminal-like domain-containing protein n=1 Tax=Streptomyces sp. NPDC088360 TaxID=3154515 RepID=UPI00344E7944
MSRPKIPDISWRACRITAAAVLAALMTAALLVEPADAEPPRSDAPTPRASSENPPASVRLFLDLDHLMVVHSLQAQASAAHQAAVEKRAAQEAAAKKRAAEEAAAKKAAATKRAEKKRAEQKAAAQRSEARTSRSGPARRTAPKVTHTVTGAKTLARSRMSSTQYACLDKLIRRESGWNHRATNPSSGAYGLMQALPASKMSSAGSDWRTNPVTQIKWGLKYIEQRYGTPCGAWDFWTKNGWY